MWPLLNSYETSTYLYLDPELHRRVRTTRPYPQPLR
jgi:hypothetical protein